MKIQQKELAIDVIIFLIIFAIALIFRAIAADLFVNCDGANYWFYRTENFYRALNDLNFSGTFQTGHPGVTLMWLSGASMAIKNYFLGMPDIFDFSDRLNLLFAAKLPIILITSLTISSIYLLIKKLFDNRKIALLCVFFILIDPIYLAQSRFFQMDAMLSSFIILSILTIFLFLKNSEKKYLILSGIFAGLAFLTKMPALILIPYVLLLFLLTQHKNFSKWIFKYLSYFDLKSKGIFKEKYVKYFLVWLAIVFVFCAVFWPAVWAGNSDIFKMFPVTGTFIGHEGLVDKEISMVNKILFYPLILLTRLTLPILALFIIGAVFLFKKNVFGSFKKNAVFKLLLFIIIWLIFFFASMKKVELGRYILPIFIPIDIIAGITFFVLLDKIKIWFLNKTKRYFVYALIGIIFITQIGIIFSYCPYYSAYRNFLFEPLSKSFLNSSLAFSLGWGEGLDEAARWLNQKENSENLIVASWSYGAFGVFFDGYAAPLDWWKAADSDYVILYHSQVYSGQHSELLNKTIYNENIIPVHIMKIKNRPFVWIYKTSDIDSD